MQIFTAESRLQWLSNASVQLPYGGEFPATWHSSRLLTLAKTCNERAGWTVPYRETLDRVLIPDIVHGGGMSGIKSSSVLFAIRDRYLAFAT